MADSAEKIRLFIVEDHEPTLNMLRRIMERKQVFQVHAFDSGEACLNNLHLDPELIMLDFDLFGSGGRMNGMDVVKKIRETEHNPRIVMLTGQDNGQTVLTLIQYGVRDYVMKDEHAFTELDAVIQDFLTRRHTKPEEED
jgi:DNA-binding NarL/FixJ family response regulator